MERQEAFGRIRQGLRRRCRDLIEALGSGPTGLEAGMWTNHGFVGPQARLDMEVAAELTERETGMLRRVIDALERMDRGEYGCCEDCGCDIPISRLRAVPDATRCVKCQRTVEEKKMFVSAASSSDGDED